MIDLLHHAVPFLSGMAAVAHRPAKSNDTDAALIALCQEWTDARADLARLTDIEASLSASNPELRDVEAQIERVIDRCWDLREEISDMPANTQEGILTKCRVALADMGTTGEGPDYAHAWMAFSALKDIVARAGA